MSTIVAISTAISNSGIGIVRMSGRNSFFILEKIFRDSKNHKINLEEIQGYSMKYGFIMDNETGNIIDEVLVSFFRNPKSYTKEDMCEINCHGGVVVENRILQECIHNGAVLAEPGEFTKRAFLNGRIDLSQAESIIDIINAKTEKEAKTSIKQLEGGLSIKIGVIRKTLLSLMADIEATIDYPEYDIEEVTNNKVLEQLNKVEEELKQLNSSFRSGKILKEGIKTAIIGKPNAGKSSLLNTILKEERAIVSDIEGTTRDTIEEFISVKGIPLKIIDTAGIRNTEDRIEKIGVEKAKNIAEDAQLILAIFDNTKELENEDFQILELIKDKNAIILLNKIDLKDNHLESKIKTNKKIIKISAQEGNGIEDIYNEIENMFELKELEQDDSLIVTNARHKTQIDKALEEIKHAKEQIVEKLPIDMIAIFIRQCLEELGKITGDNVSEDIINEIFSKFCLGK